MFAGMHGGKTHPSKGLAKMLGVPVAGQKKSRIKVSSEQEKGPILGYLPNYKNGT